MVLDPAANFVRGTTDSQINSTNTTLSVTDASIFPDPSSEGEYNVVVWDAANHPRPDEDSDVEIMRVSARDTNNNDLTVSRGQETTSGASHPSGAAVMLSPTAKMFGDIETTFGNFWDAANSELTADVNNSSTVTEHATVTDSRLYIYSATGDLLTNIDPANTATPLQDATDIANNNGGGSILTPDITEDGEYNPRSDVHIQGMGDSRITFTDTISTGGWVFDQSVDRFSWDGITLDGPADYANGTDTTQTPPAIVMNDLANDCTAGRWRILNWGAEALKMVDGHFWQSDLGTLAVRAVDAGDVNALIDWEDTGPAVTFDTLLLSPVNDRTGSNSIGIRTAGGAKSLTVHELNCGGVCGDIIDQTDGQLKLGNVNYEPAVDVSGEFGLFTIRGSDRFEVGSIRLGGEADVTNVVNLVSNTVENKVIGPIQTATGVSVANNVRVAIDLGSASVFYFGPSADVNNTTGSELSHPVACIGDGVYKTSTGTGFTADTDRRVVTPQTDSLTAADGSTVDATYGSEERDVIQNLVTRQGELETALSDAGIIDN